MARIRFRKHLMIIIYYYIFRNLKNCTEIKYAPYAIYGKFWTIFDIDSILDITAYFELLFFIFSVS